MSSSEAEEAPGVNLSSSIGPSSFVISADCSFASAAASRSPSTRQSSPLMCAMVSGETIECSVEVSRQAIIRERGRARGWK